MNFLPGWFPAGASSKVRRATIQHTDNAFSAADSTQYIFSNQSFGPPRPDRRIIVGISNDGLSLFQSVIVGGVSASLLVGTGDEHIASLWIAPVPTGSSGDVVVNYFILDGNIGTSIGVWALYGASPTPHDTAATTSAENPASENIDVPKHGAVVGFARAANTANLFSWTGLPEDFDEGYDSTFVYSGASGEFGQAQPGRTVTANNNAVSRLVVASFAPA